MKESEKAIERALAAAVKERLGLCIKLTSPQFTGLPDRICLMPGGRVVFCELKSSGQKPTARQLFVHGQLRQLGFKVFVIDSKEQINSAIDAK
jgi:hypothetical protein